MKKLDQRVAMSIASLNPETRFQDFKGWLQSSLDEETGKFHSLRGDDLAECAVRAGVLKDILKQVATAQTTLNSLTKSAGGVAGSR